MSFLSEIEVTIINSIEAGTVAFAANILTTFRGVFIIGFSIWILLIAYETAFGKNEDGLTYIMTKLMRMFLIGTIALWGWPEVSELLTGIKEGFVGTGTMSGILERELITPLTTAYAKTILFISSTFQGLTFGDLDQIFILIFYSVICLLALLILTVVVGLVATVSFAMYLVATTIFILLLAIGPFFLLCLAFPFTQRFFETYIGNVMTSIFAMAFTVLLINIVSASLSLPAVADVIPDTGSVKEFIKYVKEGLVTFFSKVGIAALLIYMYFKIFDLAAALGGGLNMGNNMIGAARTIARDAMSGGKGGGGKSPNSIGQGGSAGGAPGRSSVRDAIAANRSFTGMGISAASAGASAMASGGMSAARSVGRSASAAGKFAYNRFSQSRGSNSISS